MAELTMPSLGADMESAKFIEWLVKPGDAVKRGQVVAVVETQKGAIDVEIWQDGVIERLIAEPGSQLPVGALLAVVGGGKTPSAAAPPTRPAASIAAAQEAAVVVPMPAAAAPPSPDAASAGRLRVSPAARKRAAELGIDLAALEAAGPAGVVSLEDVERAGRAGIGSPGSGLAGSDRGPAGRAAPGRPAGQAAAAAPEQPMPGAEREDWRVPMRRAIAAAMARSKREIPHYYLGTDIDVGRTFAWLAEENERRPVERRLLPVVPLMKAVALALRTVPELNGTWQEGAHRPASAVHLGMAIAMRGGGLVAPAIHDAHAKDLDELMADLRDLVTRVRGGRLRSSELTDATVTLTNLGDLGVERVFGVIYPPQVAIIGLGRPADRPWVVDGVVTVRKVIGVSVAADHRASDGQRGAAFLNELDRLLQSPDGLGAAR